MAEQPLAQPMKQRGRPRRPQGAQRVRVLTLRVPEELLRKCGFRDPLLDDDWVFNWARMESTALCVIRKAKARASSRDFETPSFIERGGSMIAVVTEEMHGSDRDG